MGYLVRLLIMCGSDDKVVYNGPLTLSGVGGQNPDPFDLVINLQDPFLYANSNGNLLMDIRINSAGGGFLATLDAVEGSSATSRVANFDSVSAATGTPYDLGLVTEFGGTQIAPEPAVGSYLLLGFASMGAGYRRLKRKTLRRGSDELDFRFPE